MRTERRNVESPRDRPVALVTGGGLRVGRAISLALAVRGFDLALHYRRSRGEAEEVAAAAEEAGGRADLFAADFSQPGEAERLAAEVLDTVGVPTVLVLSASSYEREPLPAITAEGFRRTLETNLLAPFLLAQSLGLAMRGAGRGHIITLLDWSLDRPDPEYLAYQAAKAGLREVTYALARGLAPEVRVNGIAPGAVLLPEGTSADRCEAVRRKTLVGHLGAPEDIARAVLYLIEAEHFVTGTVLRVDGGRALL